MVFSLPSLTRVGTLPLVMLCQNFRGMPKALSIYRHISQWYPPPLATCMLLTKAADLGKHSEKHSKKRIQKNIQSITFQRYTSRKTFDREYSVINFCRGFQGSKLVILCYLQPLKQTHEQMLLLEHCSIHTIQQNLLAWFVCFKKGHLPSDSKV